MVTAIVLAAGRSRRMGRSKPLLPLGDRTAVERVVDALLAVPVEDVVVVTRAADSRIREALAGRPVRFVTNPDPQGEMLSSVQTGLRACPDSSQWALIAMVDQPLISEDTHRAMVRRAASSRHLVLTPTFGGRGGHPILLSRGLFWEALALGPDQSLKDLVRAHESEVEQVPVEDEAVVRDMDDPQSYERELRRLGLLGNREAGNRS